jgi:hypothetical protein
MINTFIAESHCYVVAHNNVDDYRICELNTGNELSSLLPHLESFETYESALARVPVEFRPNDEQL